MVVVVVEMNDKQSLFLSKRLLSFFLVLAKEAKSARHNNIIAVTVRNKRTPNSRACAHRLARLNSPVVHFPQEGRDTRSGRMCIANVHRQSVSLWIIV
jgi:hypothetical protein